MASNKLHNLQYLRGVAAVSAVFAHAHATTPLNVGMGSYPFSSGIGLGVFFITSGFIMMYTGADEFGRPGGWWRFARRRLTRIVPLYCLMTLIAFALHNISRHGHATATELFKSLLFVPFVRDGGIKPVLGIGWTLNYEMMFYAIFTIALCFPRRIGLPLAALALGTLPLIHFAHPHSASLQFWANPLQYEFLLGMGIGWLYLKGVRLPARYNPVAIAVSFSTAAFMASSLLGLPNAIFYALAALPVAVAVLGRDIAPRTWLMRFLARLGDASYALYLTHPLVLSMLSLVFARLPLAAWWFYPAIGVPLAVMLALVVNPRIEAPMSRLARTTLDKWLSFADLDYSRRGQAVRPA